MLSMLFMGLSIMWFIVAMYAIIDLGIVKGRSKYTLYVRFAVFSVLVSILTCCQGLGGLWCFPSSP